MCFGLKNITEVKPGQIAHLDRDRSNAEIDNLAYLCELCHTQYDTKNNRVQAFTAGEIRHYRDQLYRALGHDHVEWIITVRVHRAHYGPVKKSVNEAHGLLVRAGYEVTLTEAPVVR